MQYLILKFNVSLWMDQVEFWLVLAAKKAPYGLY